MRAITPIEINLDRARGLVLSWQAISLAERKINEFRGAQPSEWLSFVSILRNGLGFADMQALVWAAQVDQKKLTFEQVGEFLLGADRDYVIGKLNELIDKHWKTDSAQAEAAEDSRPLAETPGSNSGHLPESN